MVAPRKKLHNTSSTNPGYDRSHMIGKVFGFDKGTLCI